MKTLVTRPKTPLLGVLDVIAEGLGRPRPRNKPSQQGWFARLGGKLWRRQLRGVDAYIERAESVSAALDRWLWKQRMRETEAWLAQSNDVFELEARLRELERRGPTRIW